MLVRDAAAMFSGSELELGEAGVWADLGAGDGIFTRALAETLPRGSVIHALDRDRSALRAIPAEHQGVRLVTHAGDFTAPWPFDGLDGIMMANSLHFVRDKAAFIRICESRMRVKGPFLIIEYDTDQGNMWVPYPVSLNALQRLFIAAGYSSIRRLGTRTSIYQRARLYAALIHAK